METPTRKGGLNPTNVADYGPLTQVTKPMGNQYEVEKTEEHNVELF